VSDCCLMPNEQLFSYTMARTSYIRLSDCGPVILNILFSILFEFNMGHHIGGVMVNMLASSVVDHGFEHLLDTARFLQ
jgi:hypothetical protein